MRAGLARGFAASLLVLVGGCLTSVLPESSSVTRWHPLAVARTSDVGTACGFVLIAVGIVVLTLEWVRVLRVVAVTPDLALVRWATVVWSLPLLVAPPLFSRDGWSYAAQGALAHLGYSPYDYGTSVLHGQIIEAVDAQWLVTTTPYGPLPLGFGSLAAGVTSDAWLLVIAHRLLALAGVALLAYAVPRLARCTGADPTYASALALASPFLLTSGVAGLHNDLLMAGLMATALVVAVEHGWFWGAAAGGAAAAVKAPGGLVCVAIVLVTLPVAASLTRRLWHLVVVGVVSSAVLFGLGLATGVGSGWISGLATPGTNNTPLSIPTLVGYGLDWLVHPGNLDSSGIVDAVRLLGSVVTVLVVLAVALRGRTGDPASAVRSAALLMTVTVMLSPAVHIWYYLWILPFVAALHLARPAQAAFLAALLVVGLSTPVDTPELTVLTLLVVVLALVLWRVPASRATVMRWAARLPLPPVAQERHGAVRPV